MTNYNLSRLKRIPNSRYLSTNQVGTDSIDDNPIISEETATLLHLQTQVVRAGLAGDWEKARMYREWADKYRQVMIEEDCADET